MKRLPVVLMMLALSLFLFAGCNKTDSPASTGAEEKPKESTAPQTPASSAGPINPLTGLENGISKEMAGRIPVGVMISNSYNALPQWGISQADIIYEMIAEGRITRFLALFQDPSSLEALGSVRSARPYYIDIAQGYEAAYLHFGGSVPAYDTIASRKELIDMDGIRGGYEGSLFIRDPQRKKELGLEHSVITSGERINKALENCGRTLKRKNQQPAFAFNETPATAQGQNAQKITVTFSEKHKPWFSYDASSGKYLRFQYGKAQMDAYYQQQLAVDNVFVLRMPLKDVPDSALHLVEITTTGSGSGYYFCGGKYVPIAWKKSSYQSPISFYDETGKELAVKPGKTFVSVVTENASVEIQP